MWEEKMTLCNGVEIPTLGLGTWQIPDVVAEEAVMSAIKLGYRHIDTAAAYENEDGVGRGLKRCSVPREEIFVTSKIPAEYKSYELAKKTIEESLRYLKTDYIDLMLIHAPRPWAEMGKADAYRYEDENLMVWKALEEGYKEGKFRAIGVSNFSVADLRNIMERGLVKPQVNQICCYIGNTPKETIEFCEKNGIVVEGYSPIATGALLKNAKLKSLAAKYGVSLPQLCIKYVLQLGLVVLPKTTHEKYMAENAKIDFEISAEDMALLAEDVR